MWKKSTKMLTGAMNQKNHDDFAGDDVNNCKLDPARDREERKAEMEYFQKMHVYKEVLGQEVHGCDSDDADQGAETHRQQSGNRKINNGENQAHHGKRRCTSVFQRTLHVASVCGTLRRGQKSWGQRNVWRTFSVDAGHEVRSKKLAEMLH